MQFFGYNHLVLVFLTTTFGIVKCGFLLKYTRLIVGFREVQ